MTLQELKDLGRTITLFLAMFRGCFATVKGRSLFSVYVKGQLSDVPRKNCEAMALRFDTQPRTLQRLLESIKWNDEQVRDRCVEIVARDHSHPLAIGTIDESGTTKSGSCTAGVSRQYNGNRGKVENCTVGVHAGYSTPRFKTILDSRLYLPEEWANDPVRRKANYIPDEIQFQTKQQIALDLIRHSVGKGICVSAWTFDEFYGRDSKFLDGLDDMDQAYVAEIPSDTKLWTSKPGVIRKRPAKKSKGRPKKIPRVFRSPVACEVRNLLKYSSHFQGQKWQSYRIKDTEKGAEVWEVKWLLVWRKTAEKLPSNQQTLIVARNVRTGELKYFLSNKIVGRNVSLRRLLTIAFGRWSIEACFRIAKEELGMDHFEVRGWRCIHRHYYMTGVSFLLCSRIRQTLDPKQTRGLTVEQVRRGLNIYLTYKDLPPPLRDQAFEKELKDQHYYQTRNSQSRKSHSKTRKTKYKTLGIDIDHIKSCAP